VGHGGRLCMSKVSIWSAVSKVRGVEWNEEWYSVPVEVEAPERYYCQNLYFPELYRGPSQHMIYHIHARRVVCLPCGRRVRGLLSQRDQFLRGGIDTGCGMKTNKQSGK
jgi:hypothetical protein